MMNKLTPAQKNLLFTQATRQNIKTMGPITVVPGASIAFEVPKSRYLSMISLLVKGTFTVTHSSATTYVPTGYAPYNLIKQARVSINNGFTPFKISGRGLYLYNKTMRNGGRLNRVTTANARGMNLMETVASSGGTANDLRFFVTLPVVINPRDPVGLVNLQHPSTVVTCEVDFNALTEMVSVLTGFTLASALTVTPVIETFTVPTNMDFRPDNSVIKLVNETAQDIGGAGAFTVKLPTGQTYRKIAWILENSSGVGLADSTLGNFEVSFNQNDIPYTINPFALQAMNELAYGHVMEAGVFVLDLTDQGIPNLGGSRDYIDTEALTEFWLSGSVEEAGKITVISETLSELREA